MRSFGCDPISNPASKGDETQHTLEPIYKRRRHGIREERVRKTLLMPAVADMKRHWLMASLVKSFTGLIARAQRNANVFEDWESNDSNRAFSERKAQSMSVALLNETEFTYAWLQTFELVVAFTCLWYTSLREVMDVNSGGVFAWILIGLAVVNLVIELVTVHLISNRQVYEFSANFTHYLKHGMLLDLMCLFAGIIYLIDQNKVPAALSVPVSCLVSVCLAAKISRHNRYFNELLDGTSFDRFFNILTVLWLLILAAHIFVASFITQSIVMNILAANSNQNWLTKIGKDQETWQVKYIYSMYWSITTMVTVGYGDITPTNVPQVIVVMVIEILGTALSAYLISTIGSTLGDMRKEAGKRDRELNILKRVGKYFGLSKELTYRIRGCLQNNQVGEMGLSLQDQRQLMDSLNDELRRDIMYETNTKVLKKNLFFMSNFSRNFRSQIALRLIKKIYQPNQMLESSEHVPNLHIIDKGTVHVGMKLVYRGRAYSKVIRTICVEGTEIRANMYGLGWLLRSSSLRTFATTKTFAFVYELTRKDFMEGLQNNPLDFQSFYELRDRVSLLRLPEALQGDSLVSSCQHYCPNRLLILKRYSFSVKQQRGKQRKSLVPFRRLKKTDRQSALKPCEGEDTAILTQAVIELLEPIIYSEERTGIQECQIDTYRNYESYFAVSNPKTVLAKYNNMSIRRSGSQR